MEIFRNQNAKEKRNALTSWYQSKWLLVIAANFTFSFINLSHGKCITCLMNPVDANRVKRMQLCNWLSFACAVRHNTNLINDGLCWIKWRIPLNWFPVSNASTLLPRKRERAASPRKRKKEKSPRKREERRERKKAVVSRTLKHIPHQYIRKKCVQAFLSTPTIFFTFRSFFVAPMQWTSKTKNTLNGDNGKYLVKRQWRRRRWKNFKVLVGTVVELGRSASVTCVLLTLN